MPRLKLDDNQLQLTVDGIDYEDHINVSNMFLSQSQLEIFDKFNKVMSNIALSDTTPVINCKYYSISEFKKQ